ncbi:EAL domain-containing protein [Undibacterium sp. GrIS 1.2]|uniref:bifunctional diguanylate cyclase/phosphodiesterase n=1 Tax=Undibacterium sp. GrIS 1.2 TaxID=3143933 RepID=UPI0033975D93
MIAPISKWVKELAFLRNSYAFILAWPLICAALISTVWWSYYSGIEQDKKLLHTNALKDAASLSRAYAQYLNRTIEQLDQISMHVKYDWEHSNRSLRLGELRSQGLFTASQFALVAILDKKANPVTSTAPMEAWQDSTLKGLFFYHQFNNSSAMQIGLPVVVNSSGKPVVQFTRRLENADEEFDGIVVISVDPSYFSSFYDEQSIGKSGLLAVLSNEGVVGTSRVGNIISHVSTDIFAKELSIKTPIGTDYFPGQSIFVDQKSRFLGWQSLDAYKVTAVVGLSEQELLSTHEDAWKHNKNSTITATIVLLLFAAIATWMSTRLAWRKYQAKEVRDTYRLATEGTDEGFYMMNALHDIHGNIIDFQVIDCNAQGALFFGLNREELVGMNMSSLQGEHYFKTMIATYSKAMEVGFYEDEYEYEMSDVSPMNIAWAKRRLVRSGASLAVTIQDISAKKEAEQELHRLANRDGLTGLYNRHWLIGYLPKAISRAKASDQMIALLFIDLDGFKNVNDTQGHVAGDHLLKSVASRLQSVLRPSDNVVRLGGDEFLVAMDPVELESKPARVAERIAEAFKQPFWWEGIKHEIGASIGISMFPRDGSDTETLLKNADIAMYSVKAAGKGHYDFFKPEIYTKLKTRFELEQALSHAIEVDQFVLYYQPRVNTITGEMTSMEALVRWIHPDKGLIPPIDFIPIAESTGMILRLGDMVIEKACAQIAAWKEAQLPVVPVSINASARQFNTGHLPQKLADCLTKYQINSALLEVEITESAMMGEDNAIIAELSSISALGIKLLVDDFGTGYSSLSQLQRLDMDILKIDRVFTNELTSSSEGEIFFKAIVSMAHALNMSVVAEGVETKEQLAALRRLSCDEIQGYFISRPVPADQIPALLNQPFLLSENQ